MKTASKEIAIYVDDIWAGTGKINEHGSICDCSAQFCDDNDRSLNVYDEIERAIGAGDERLTIEIDGRSRKIEWTIRD